MPFNLFRRGSSAGQGPGSPGGSAGPGPRPGSTPAAGPEAISFEALTEDWRLRGTFEANGRLADVLNKREAIPIRAVSWAPADGSDRFSEVPGLQSVDPYDLIVVVLTGTDSRSVQDPERAAAGRLHKIEYDVALDCPPYRVVGTVHLFPGSEPDRILERQTELFVAVTDPLVFHGPDLVRIDDVEVALVNRSYLRGVEQVDRKTLARVRPLPGRPLGGTSYRTD
ncbi:MAG: hypothetical protein ACRDGL_11855 [Candidatus Limnocylindrales bacterium]